MKKKLPYRDTRKLFHELTSQTLNIFYKLNLKKGKYEYVSPSIERNFGYTQKEFEKGNFEFFQRIRHPDDQNNLVEKWNKLTLEEKQNHDKQFHFEYRIKHKDGTYHWFQDDFQLVVNRMQEPVYTLGAVREISDVKTISQRLSKSESELVKAQKLEALGVLAGGIAHDFNNILTSILGNLSLVKFELEKGTDLFENLSEIEIAAFRAKDLTNQLLTFSKGGAPIKQTSDIREIIKESAEFMLRGSTTTCKFEFENEIHPVDVDRGQINQVLNNLIINAEQAMPQNGYLIIRVGNSDHAEISHFANPELNFIKIQVQDFGSGIAHQFQTKIFDPYFTTKQKGSGLGLATSYSIIKRHEGFMDFASEKGHGTTFTIYLPASKKKIEHRKSPAKHDKEKFSYKILVMDDEIDVLNIANKMLNRLGCEVLFVRDGSDAVKIFSEEAAAKKPFDFVLLDLTIRGGMGGKETINRLRQVDPNVVAIVCSGYSTDPIMANFHAHGFQYSLPKPFTMDELKHLLNRISHDFELIGYR